MPIHFRCQSCQARLSVSSRKAGAHAKCPRCGERIRVPADPQSPVPAASPQPSPIPPEASKRPAAESAAQSATQSADESVDKPGAEPAAARSVVQPAAEPAAAPQVASPAVPAAGQAAAGQAAPPVQPPLPQERAPATQVGAWEAPVLQESCPAPASPLAGNSLEPPRAAVVPSIPGLPAEVPLDSVEPPPVGAAAAAPLPGPAASPPEQAVPTALDPFAEFLVYEDAEIVYEDTDQEPIVARGPLPFDPDKVAVRRSILYLQGALLGLVALFSFGLGLLLGASGGRTGAEIQEPRPCEISGRIVLLTRTEAMLSDQGAVALVVPQDARPEAKLSLIGLRPQDSQWTGEHPTLRALRDLGGDYARADSEGRYRLRVPDRGEYFLLVISASRHNPGEELPRQSLAQLGRYFQLAPDLFGDQECRWQAETVRGDRELNFTF